MESQGEKEPSSTMLYVSNLPFSFDDEQLAEVFAKFEPANAYIATRRNGRSKGFGFVNFNTAEAQQNALSEIDGQELEGRTLTVKIAHKDERRDTQGRLKEEFRRELPKPRKQKRKGGAGGNGGNNGGQQNGGRREVKKEPSQTILYVANLPFSFGDAELLDLFSEFAPVSARIAIRRNGKSKGFGFVEVAGPDVQQSAIERLDGHSLEDREISVQIGKVPVDDADKKEPSDVTIYVSNLPYALTDEEFSKVWTDQGLELVSCRIARRRNGSSKGYGFAEFADKSAQTAALEKAAALNIDDRPVTARIAIKGSEIAPPVQEPEKRQQKPKRERVPSATILYVSNLPFEVEDDALKGLFEDCGEITSAHVARRRNGKSKGFGFVEFSNNEGQLKGLEKNGTEFEGRSLTVEISNTPQEAPQQENQGDDNNNNNNDNTNDAADGGDAQADNADASN